MTLTINIIGAGIAGLSAGCYLQMNGFKTRIFESHNQPGGLCTSWGKGDYTIDGCLHWLVGSGPADPFHKLWNELVDLKKIEFVDPQEFFRIADASGKEIIVYTDIDRLHREMMEKAPEDEKVINEFVRAVKKLDGFKMRVDKAPELFHLFDHVKMFFAYLPYFGMLGKYSKILTKEFAAQCKNPLLKKMFESAFDPEMPILFILMTFLWLNRKSAGYPVGGSLNFSRMIEKKYLELGGQIHYHQRVRRILTEPAGKGQRAKGIELESGAVEYSDITISAADGHFTIFEMLEGKFLDQKVRHIYEHFKTFPSYLQVSLGVARTFEGVPAVAGYPLTEPFQVDPEEKAEDFSYRIMNYDPTLAPAGKTLVIAMLRTYNYRYWTDLRRDEKTKYEAEKKRIAEFVIEELETKLGGIRENLEMLDVSTPATVIRYTNNWKGSFEGWLMTRDTGFKSLQKTLPGLNDFYLCGHWVEPGGGVPAALLSGRNLAQVIGRKYKK